MIVAIYTKNKQKDKWLLYAIAPTMEKAKKSAKKAINQAKKIGFEEADAVIQTFNDPYSIPQVLGTSKPEKLNYN